MIFDRIFAGRRREQAARRLYAEVVAQSRHPDFYLRWGVPDTVDGRFDMVVLHAFLVMRRLGLADGKGSAEARALSQSLFDLMFADMDQNLREMGVSDLAVGNKIRKMVEAFYGRVAAYDAALGTVDDELAAALTRNIYREAPPTAEAPKALAAYLRRQAAALDRQPITALLEGGAGLAEIKVA